MNPQPGILAPVPPVARYLSFDLLPRVNPGPALQALRDRLEPEGAVVGLGMSLTRALGAEIDGIRQPAVHSGPGFHVPSTPGSLWIWLRGDDRGELVHATRQTRALLHGAFEMGDPVDAFRYRDGRDLSGYVDGTENPEGDDAVVAGIASGLGTGLDGSSFVAVQQWVHDLDLFASMDGTERDHTIGRRLADNEELPEAPESAHVKRTAQETFEPAAFILRRSMPWADARREGLVFVAFGKSFDAFEALLDRMVGRVDGISDALFRFTRPITSAYYWCPPLHEGRLDLRALGL